MTDEKINIKIAELCNLFRIAPLKRTTRKGKDDPNGVVFWYCSEDHGGAKTYDRLPNYTEDLNACHEFEKTLDTYELAEYWHNLLRAHGHIPEFAGCSDARQRCEAFLRVHGQWEEEA